MNARLRRAHKRDQQPALSVLLGPVSMSESLTRAAGSGVGDRMGDLIDLPGADTHIRWVGGITAAHSGVSFDVCQILIADAPTHDLPGFLRLTLGNIA
jgi:hypothetical protein